LGIKDISEKIGFTKLELNVIVFLLFVFITGFIIKTYWLSEKNKPVIYDYSKQDSLFLNIGNYSNDIEGKTSAKDKKVDYKQEVLDFRKREFKAGNSNDLPAENSIDINKAAKSAFERLPGIGPKTADKIIAYRIKIKRFEKLDELLNVKGIGKTKFNKIKKYLYIKK
jgi:competence ComEA-like helix-hairpin-helix protein